MRLWIGLYFRDIWGLLLRAALVMVTVASFPWPAHAISTGNLTGTITSNSGAAVTGAAVSAVSPSGDYRARTSERGFYSILNIPPDTYTITVSAEGYDSTIINGVTVFQDQNVIVNAGLQPVVASLGRVTTVAPKASLVQPSEPSNTYNMTPTIQRLVLGDPTPHSIPDLLYRTPGITSGPALGVPTVRGGIYTELGLEFDEIPVVSRVTGYPTTFLGITGLANVAVTTGGLAADQSQSNGGIINMVVKQGSYQQNGTVTFGVGGPAYDHTLGFEYGAATANNQWSLFLAGSYANVDKRYGEPGTFYYEHVTGTDWENAKGTTGNVHYRWGTNNHNDLQYVFDVGVWVVGNNYGGSQGNQLAVVGEVPNNVTAPGCSVANPCIAELLARKLGADDLYRGYTVQKLAYNTTINDRSYLRARVAQSLADYTYDGEWAQNVGEPCLENGCTFGQGYYAGDLWCYWCYYQVRHSLQTFYNIDYANQLSAHNLVKIGAGYEYDKNLRKVSNGLAATDPNTGAYLGWPFYNTVNLAPTELYGAYASDYLVFGKWVVEPGLRWDLERYSISPVQLHGVNVPGTATPFGESFVSPRIAATYQASPSDVFRASYGYLGQFAPSMYVENFGRAMYFGPEFTIQYSAVKPATALSFDFSWEHMFPHQVSMRITPYLHNNDHYPDEETLFHGPTVVTYDVSTHTKGAELGVSRQVADGLSTFVSFTYDDTITNAPDFFGNAFGGGDGANIKAKNFQPATWAGSFVGNLALDWKHSGWQIISNTSWTTATPYGVGDQGYLLDERGRPVIASGASCVTSPAGQTQCLDNAEIGRYGQDLRGPASFLEDLTLARSLGRGQAGVSFSNLFNTIASPIPTPNFNYLNGYESGNWVPQGDCPLPSQWPGQTCYATVYPAPNAYVYPTTGYYRQQSQAPRQIRVWYQLAL